MLTLFLVLAPLFVMLFIGGIITEKQEQVSKGNKRSKKRKKHPADGNRTRCTRNKSQLNYIRKGA